MSTPAGLSRDPSRAQLQGASRPTSHLVAKGQSGSKAADGAPGRSSLSRLIDSRGTYLELRASAPGAQPQGPAWPTERDIAILQSLDSYRYLDRWQLQALFFEGPRSCQMRLKWLTERGLVRAWQAVVRPGHVRSASVFLLARRGAQFLAQLRNDDPRPYVARAEHAFARNHHVIHDLEANQFYVDVAVATRDRADLGLYHWVAEHGIKRAYAERHDQGPVADGWGRLLVGADELFLHLEWDRGSEQTRRLHGKLEAYVRYFRDRPHASCNHVLFVAPSEQRREQIARLAERLVPRGRECCRVWTVSRGQLAEGGPLAQIWRGSSDWRTPVAIPELQARHAAPRLLSASICKPRWWSQRPGGGEGV